MTNRCQIFIKEGCSNCNEFVEFMKQTEIQHEVVNVSTKEGFELSNKHEIMKLPTVLLLNSKEEAIDRIYTLYELRELVKSQKNSQ